MTDHGPRDDRARDRRANAWTETGFAFIQRRYRVAFEREKRYREQVLLEKYRQTRPPSIWLTCGERARLATFTRAQDRAIDEMMVLLDQIGGREWWHGVPIHWVMTEVTYADAVTTGPLSVIPLAAYGYTTLEMEQFAAAVSEPERAAGGWQR